MFRASSLGDERIAADFARVMSDSPGSWAPAQRFSQKANV